MLTGELSCPVTCLVMVFEDFITSNSQPASQMVQLNFHNF